jgi:hypothetical protein
MPVPNMFVVAKKSPFWVSGLLLTACLVKVIIAFHHLEQCK